MLNKLKRGTMLDYKKLSDAQLVRLFQASNEAAFTEIYDRYYPLLFYHAVKKLKDKEQAEDIIHDLFTKFWIRREGPLNTENLPGYLYTLLKNRILDFFNHKQTELKYATFVKVFEAGNKIPRTDYLIREKQMNDRIDKEIAALPPKMRAIFILSRKEQLSYSEIAQKLNTNENNVSKQINNGLKILKGRLG